MSRRVDLRCFTSGGGGLGLGHVLRSLEVAREAHARGMRVAMALRGDGPTRAIVRERCPAVEIEPWDAPEDAARPAAWTLFDTRESIAAELAAAARAGARRLVLDRSDHEDAADWTVLPNLHSPPCAHPRISRGAEWCIVAREIRAIASGPELPRDSVLVTLGGSDPHDLTSAILDPLAKALAAHSIARVDVVIGRCFGSREVGLQRVRELGWRIHFDLGRHEIGLLMRRAAFAICGFGISVYELACLGTPMVYLVHHDSDTDDAERLERKGVGLLGGGGSAFDAAKFQRRLEASTLSQTWRERAAKLARRHVGDGAGAVRIAERLCSALERFEGDPA
jgi:spore coat polysaccharide biosynthesis predicted glycosyltransferase SpsG